MSRAFVKEDAAGSEEPLPDRPISPHTNFVTARGLAQIDAHLQRLTSERQSARTRGDAAIVASTERDLRYWTARRASARLVPPAARPDSIRFGVGVTVARPDGSTVQVRLVGEDEADPAAGLINWASPVARALLGLEVGDRVDMPPYVGEVLALTGGDQP